VGNLISDLDRPGREFSIRLPWPDRRLHAQTRGSRWKKISATTAAREAAFMLGQAEKQKATVRLPIEVCEVSYLFVMPSKTRRDVANLIQSCKPFIDGLVDAGIVSGDDWTKMRIAGADAIVAKSRHSAGVVIKFEELLPWCASD